MADGSAKIHPVLKEEGTVCKHTAFREGVFLGSTHATHQNSAHIVAKSTSSSNQSQSNRHNGWDEIPRTWGADSMTVCEGSPQPRELQPYPSCLRR